MFDKLNNHGDARSPRSYLKILHKWCIVFIKVTKTILSNAPGKVSLKNNEESRQGNMCPTAIYNLG